MVETVLAGTLGAALLAIVLLYQGYRRNRALIIQLRQELQAQKTAPRPSPAGSPGDASRSLWERSLARVTRKTGRPGADSRITAPTPDAARKGNPMTGIGVPCDEELNKTPYGYRPIHPPSTADPDPASCTSHNAPAPHADCPMTGTGPRKPRSKSFLTIVR